jgi:hypothetical protein
VQQLTMAPLVLTGSTRVAESHYAERWFESIGAPPTTAMLTNEAM